MLTAIQHASIASKFVSVQHCPSAPLDGASPVQPGGTFATRPLPISALLYLATLGGAEVCCLADVIGSFAPGKAFDALLVSVCNDCGNPGLWGVDAGEHFVGKEALGGHLEKFLFCGDDRNIKRVYVQGKMVGGTQFVKEI